MFDLCSLPRHREMPGASRQLFFTTILAQHSFFGCTTDNKITHIAKKGLINRPCQLIQLKYA